MDFLKDSVKKKQFFYSYGVFLINGMLALSLGALLPFIRESRGIDYAFGGIMMSLHSVGNLISSFAGGTLPIFVGRKKSILFFNIFMAISFAMIIFGENNYVIAAAFFLTGIARGATSNFCNAMVNGLAPGKAWMTNGLHATFAVGAFMFPIILTILTSMDASNWIYACYFMLAMGVLSWLLYFMMPVDQDKVEKKDGKTKEFGFFKEPLFYLSIGTLFFYLCAEQGVISWMITYFKDTGLLSDSLSQITASVLWIMILIGRLLTAWASTKVDKGRLLPVMGVGLVVFFIVLILSKSTPLIVFGIMGFGFSMSGIYPTTVSFTGELIKKYQIAWSFILTFASLGSILMPSIIGAIAENAGIFYGMSSVAAAVVIDLVFIILLVNYTNKHKVEQ